jgi:hypothetical protein
MQRLDTTLTVIDAHKHIVAGYVLPFWTRALDGVFYDIETNVYFVPAEQQRLTIWSDHDRSPAGVVGLATVENDGKGFYATVQLADHLRRDWYMDRIGKGQIAFSHDSAAPDKPDADGYVSDLTMIGASLTAWPYIRPNYIASAEQYMGQIMMYATLYGGSLTVKRADPALERMPLPVRRTPCL